MRLFELGSRSMVVGCAVALTMSMGFPSLSVAQVDSNQTATDEAVKEFERRAKYLRSKNLQSNYDKIRSLVTPEIREKYRPRGTGALAIDSDAQLGYIIQGLAVQYSYNDIVRLREKGIDLVKSTISFMGPSTSTEFVGLHETVVVGTIVRVEREDLGDGFLSTAVVHVDEWLKGPDKTDTVRIRQFGGYLSNGNVAVHPRDVVTAGRVDFSYPTGSHVFLLSKARYGLGIASRTGRIVDGLSKLYTQGIKALPIIDGTIVRPSGLIAHTPIPKTLPELRNDAKKYE